MSVTCTRPSKIESPVRVNMYTYCERLIIIRKLHQRDNGQALFLCRVLEHPGTRIALCSGNTPSTHTWGRTTDVHDDDLVIEYTSINSRGDMNVKFKHASQLFTISSAHVDARVDASRKYETIAITPTLMCTIPARWTGVFDLRFDHKSEVKHRIRCCILTLYRHGFVRDIVWYITDLGCELLRLDTQWYCVYRRW